MKIGIITIHYGINYGSALQSYALAKYISKNLNDVEVINYIPERYTKKRRYFYTNKDIKGLKKVLYLILVAPNTFRYQLIFDSFLNKYVPIGKKIYSIDEIKERYSGYDVLITGSDQVWNSDYNEGVDPAYYLSFASETSHLFSYAASCGKDIFDTEEINECINYWNRFDAISLREDVTTEWFKSIGYSDSVHVLDPIFLLSQDEWKQIMTRREISEPYVFIYALDDDIEDAINIANIIKQQFQLKIVMISYGHIWSHEEGCDYYITGRGPRQFLSLIYNADYVITNSFHGIAFSLRFRKQFIPLMRQNYNNRIESVLRLVKLEDRLVMDNNAHFSKINYEDCIDQIIYEMEQISKSYLQGIIK